MFDLFGENKSYKEKTRTHEELIQYVDSFVSSNIKSYNFMIAGGALVDSNLGKKFKDYNDIDIFFECAEDYDFFTRNLKKHFLVIKTDNAATYENNGVQIQLIHKFFGTPEQILNKFDLYQSKLLITSKGERFTQNIDNILTVDYNNYGKDTPMRFLKYYEKGIGTDAFQFQKLIDYQLSHLDDEFVNLYDKSVQKGAQVFENFVHKLYHTTKTAGEKWINYIYFKLKETLTEEEMIKFFESFYQYKLPQLYKEPLFCISMINGSKNYLGDIDHSYMKKQLGELNYHNAQKEYPEYFI